jgi:nitrite reductase/ring-hydroxylating ferredoxin subunit
MGFLIPGLPMPPTTLPLADLPPGAIKRIELDGAPVCVANVDGEIYAVSDSCTHARIPLSDGALEGRMIICPWHGAMFDLKTGRAVCGPAVDPLRIYKTRINDDQITVE